MQQSPVKLDGAQRGQVWIMGAAHDSKDGESAKDIQSTLLPEQSRHDHCKLT